MNLSLDKKNIEELFPFYLLVDNKNQIISVGKSLNKLNVIDNKRILSESFIALRPNITSLTVNSIASYSEQVIILESKEKKIRFRGQILKLESNDLLFIIAPWITTLDEMKSLDLTMSDFSISNMTPDMLQVIKSKELIMEDIKLLLKKLENQKKEINDDRNRIELILTKLNDGILVEDEKRRITQVNKRFCELFSIPVDPINLIGVDCSSSAEQTKGMFKDEKGFIEEIDITLNEKKERIGIILELKNGKFYERDYIPIYDNGKYIGHLWKYKDITENITINRLIKHNEEKYRSVIENLELGLLEVDNENNITKVYEGFCSITGYSEKELIGKNPSFLVSRMKDKDTMIKENEKRSKGIGSVYEVLLNKKNGDTAWVLISGAPIFDVEGKIIGSIGIHLDITSRKKKEEEYILAKEEAEKASKFRQIFLANMSHEIRTPINVINGIIDLLLETELSFSQTKDLKLAKSSTLNLKDIVNDILDLSKIESGKTTVNNTVTDLKLTLIEIVDSHQLIAKEKNISLKLELDSRIPGNLIFDQKKIKQIIINLISNAIKFTEKGTVTTEAFIKNDSREKCFICFKISDTGIGIKKEKINSIFEPFSQEDPKISAKYGGTGLGLTITRELVTLLNGNINIESEEGKGTTFTIEIPFQKGKKEKSNRERSSINKPLEYFKILITEDNELNQLVASRILESLGASVEIANNGKIAIEKLEKESFTLILMDIQMPEMDGYEATIKIRKHNNPEIKSIPIIGLSAHAIEGEREKCISLGMNDYLTKPFEKNELANAIVKSVGKTENIDLSYFSEIATDDSNLFNNLISETIKNISELKISIKDNTENLSACIHKATPTLKIIGQNKLVGLIVEYNHQLKKDLRNQKLMTDILDHLENLITALMKTRP